MIRELLERVVARRFHDFLRVPWSRGYKVMHRLMPRSNVSRIDSGRHRLHALPLARQKQAGETCSKHRVARLMRTNHLRALHGYRTRRWSVGKPSVLIPNLLRRQFTVTRRNKVWVTDITYTRTWQGWLYLAVVMDLFSRRIVGWAARPSLHPELVLEAVLMAVRRRQPRGTLIHSDQGTQYGCDAWGTCMRSRRSMMSAGF